MSRPSLRPLNTEHCLLNTVYGLLFTFLLAACTPAPTPSPLPLFSTPPPLLTPSPPPTPPTATPRPPVVACSPFINHPLEELSQFVSQAFQISTPGRDDGHPGTDFAHWAYGDEASIEGDPLQAVLPGRIAAAVHNRPPYGNMLIIEVPFENLPPAVVEGIPIPDGQSIYMLYAHLKDAPGQTPGEPVECGRELNRAGSTGAAVAPHLHFETQWGPPGMTFDGMAYYIADATPLELQNYETWHMSGEFHPFDPMLLLNLLQP